MKPAIKTQNLSVVLGGKVKALRNLTIELPEGQIIGLLGPSGAGKTTLMRTIIGRQLPYSGEIEVLGYRPGDMSARRQIGYMPQQASVYSDLTVMENLRYFAKLFRAGHKEIDVILDEVGMSRYAERLVSDLSDGQQSRVSLAIALLGKPGLLILDEPTVGIDPVLRKQLWQIFRKRAEAGATLLVSSHVMDEAEHCDSLLLIRGGKILAMGTPAELCRDNNVETIEEVFLKLVKKERV
jgi:ABC-2 type transport system ATP-binding protein